MSPESPVISIDCKKKELLGNLYREGKCYVTAPIKVYDHDYTSLSKGKVIPHGIYDLQAKGISLLETVRKQQSLLLITCVGGGQNTVSISTQMLEIYLFYVMQEEGIPTGITYLKTKC
jgi:hypothetical protein